MHTARTALALSPCAIVGIVIAATMALISVGSAADNGAGVSRADLIAAMERGPGPVKGPSDAPVTMVEFSDFRCGYCRMFALQTLPKLDERYMRPGKVRFLYRHMALQGEAAVMAARAAVCAHAQGRVWEYHDALFGQKSPLGFTQSALTGYAASLRLDGQAFSACLDSDKTAETVKLETAIAQALGIRGTPAFLVNGQLAIGAYPFEAFQQALDPLLAAREHERPGQKP